jgi:hypothetical protein
LRNGDEDSGMFCEDSWNVSGGSLIVFEDSETSYVDDHRSEWHVSVKLCVR